MSKEWPLWEVFIRSQHGLAHKHVGSVHAPDSEMAVMLGREFSDNYLTMCRNELALSQEPLADAVDEVTKWELNRYLEHT